MLAIFARKSGHTPHRRPNLLARIREADRAPVVPMPRARPGAAQDFARLLQRQEHRIGVAAMVMTGLLFAMMVIRILAAVIAGRI